MSNQLKDLCPQDRCERSLKMIGLPAIRFIPKEKQYDVEGSTNEFTVQLNLGDPPTSSSTSSKKRKAEEEPDKIPKNRTRSDKRSESYAKEMQRHSSAGTSNSTP